MSGLRLAVLPFVVLAASGLAVPARSSAQDSIAVPCRLCTTSGDDRSNAPAAVPLRLEVETRLDFDKVVFDGKGSALVALSPGGIARLTGAATAAGARAMPGSVLVRGEPGRAVTVELRVAYGRYRFRLTTASAAATNMSPMIDAEATVSPAKPVARVGALRLRAAAQIASASRATR